MAGRTTAAAKAAADPTSTQLDIPEGDTPMALAEETTPSPWAEAQGHLDGMVGESGQARLRRWIDLVPGPEAKHIHYAMRQVMAEVGPMQLDATGPEIHGSYGYTSYGQIIAKLRVLFVKYGIATSSRVIQGRSDVSFAPNPPASLRNDMEITDETKPVPVLDPETGMKIELTRAEGKDVRLVDVHTRTEKGGGERIVWNGKVPAARTQALVFVEYTFTSVVDGSTETSIGVGESADTGDKAIRKATTSAHKEALIQTFHLDSNDTVDMDGSDINEELERAAVVRQARGEQNIQQARGAKIDPTPRPLPDAIAAAVEPTPEQVADVAREQGAPDAAAKPEPAKRSAPRARKAKEEAPAAKPDAAAGEQERAEQAVADGALEAQEEEQHEAREAAAAPEPTPEAAAEVPADDPEITIEHARAAFRAAREKRANSDAPITPAEEDAIAASLLGGKTRQEWTKVPAEMKLVADAIARGDVA